MTEEANAATEAQDAPEQQAAPEFKPPQTQEELEKLINTAVGRTHKKYADYEDLKARAANAEKAVAEARQAGEKSAAEKFADKLFQAEVRARAVELGFHDPTDAIAQFGPRDGVVNGLDLDSDALSKRLTEVAESKPYLLKSQPGPRVAQKPKLPGNDDKKQPKEPANGSRAAAALRAFSSNR